MLKIDFGCSTQVGHTMAGERINLTSASSIRDLGTEALVGVAGDRCPGFSRMALFNMVASMLAAMGTVATLNKFG
jgi:hypothetical protein